MTSELFAGLQIISVVVVATCILSPMLQWVITHPLPPVGETR
jgi:hypothetical protein